MERRDVIVVASVSCIYGLGAPEEYARIILALEAGARSTSATTSCGASIDMQFVRNDVALTRATFRVRGDVLELQPADEEIVIRVEFFGDEVEKITLVDPLTGELQASKDEITIFPASHFVASSPERHGLKAMHRYRGGDAPARGPLQAERQAAGSPAHRAADAVRPGDDPRGRLLQRGSRTTRAGSMGALRARRRTHCWTTSRTTT